MAQGRMLHVVQGNSCTCMWVIQHPTYMTPRVGVPTLARAGLCQGNRFPAARVLPDKAASGTQRLLKPGRHLLFLSGAKRCFLQDD